MRKWAKWCVNNHLRWVVYFAGVLTFPLYFLYYFPEACGDWISDMKSIAKEQKK